jgi:hypothetical protein
MCGWLMCNVTLSVCSTSLAFTDVGELGDGEEVLW